MNMSKKEFKRLVWKAIGIAISVWAIGMLTIQAIVWYAKYIGC
jgi:hypothetical protein